MNSNLLSCQNLSQSFQDADGELVIFSDLNLELKQGETLAIIGASGSGKSTLLYLLGGLERPKSGTISIANQPLSKLSDNQLAKFRNQNLGFIYQFHHLLAEFTALENVAMPLMIKGESAAVAKKQAMLVLEQVGLGHRLTHKPSELSGGERQRTAIARALVTKPKCILADEPTGNLDNHTAKQVYELLLDLNKQYQTSMVIVTHDMHLASTMDRKVLLEDGKLQEI